MSITAPTRTAGRGLAFLLALSLAAGPAAAKSAPANLSDLAYQSSEWARGQMRSRGYTLMSSASHKGKTFEYWWSAGSNSCARLTEVGGKVESVDGASSTDCRQSHSEATSGDAAAAIAIGAAALIGVAVLAHQSHERDEEHGRDAKSVAEFDRGYRDGLYHQAYHNYNKTSAYSDGYNAGQTKRDEETSYRSHHGHHSGDQPYVSLSDLEGARGSSFDSEIRSRGFEDKGGYKQGDRSIALWWNGRTRQCVQSVTKEGRIQEIEAIDEGNCT